MKARGETGRRRPTARYFIGVVYDTGDIEMKRVKQHTTSLLETRQSA